MTWAEKEPTPEELEKMRKKEAGKAYTSMQECRIYRGQADSNIKFFIQKRL
jgi:hypothetical protein